jgi:hypothetical protein
MIFLLNKTYSCIDLSNTFIFFGTGKIYCSLCVVAFKLSLQYFPSFILSSIMLFPWESDLIYFEVPYKACMTQSYSTYQNTLSPLFSISTCPLYFMTSYVLSLCYMTFLERCEWMTISFCCSWLFCANLPSGSMSSLVPTPRSEFF